MNSKNLRHLLESCWEVVKAGYPARKLVVIGITGTDGKTTTSHLVYEMLKSAGIKVALVSTVAAYIGSEEIDTGFHVTTPDAKLLQPLIKKIVDAGMTHLILEVTSHGLDQHRVLGCNFQVGVITNITHEHLDYHKTFEKYRSTKAKLIIGTKYAILNADDPSFEYLKDRSGGEIIPYTKTKTKISNPKLAGDYNLYNIAAAEAVAKIYKIQSTIVNKALDNFPGVPGRLEEIKNNLGFRTIVDFAHTPNALEKVLTELKSQLPKNKKLILVFGCAGLRDHTKRPMMGEIATRLADKVIITAEDPRTENIDDIYNDIVSNITPKPPLKLRGGAEGGGVTRVDDRQEAINKAIGQAKTGDIVVVTGKGHEKSMCFGTTEYPWSDKQALERAIKKYGV